MLTGAKLDMCQCKPGFVDRATGKGRTCYACEQGKSAAQFGSRSCIDCTAGTACGCSSNKIGVSHENCTGLEWSPACSSCQLCNSGRFQNKDAKGRCSTCKDGFECNQPGMTYPIATPGYWVDPRNPDNQQKCHPKEACPGSTLFNKMYNTLDNVPREMQFCFKDKPPAQGRAECNNLYGSRCAEGYAGEACGKCCKKADEGSSGCVDGRMWFKTAGVRFLSLTDIVCTWPRTDCSCGRDAGMPKVRRAE
jgi:hypothetical protein